MHSNQYTCGGPAQGIALGVVKSFEFQFNHKKYIFALFGSRSLVGIFHLPFFPFYCITLSTDQKFDNMLYHPFFNLAC